MWCFPMVAPVHCQESIEKLNLELTINTMEAGNKNNRLLKSNLITKQFRTVGDIFSDMTLYKKYIYVNMVLIYLDIEKGIQCIYLILLNVIVPHRTPLVFFLFIYLSIYLFIYLFIYLLTLFNVD